MQAIHAHHTKIFYSTEITQGGFYLGEAGYERIQQLRLVGFLNYISTPLGKSLTKDKMAGVQSGEGPNAWWHRLQSVIDECHPTLTENWPRWHRLQSVIDECHPTLAGTGP